MAIAAVPDYLGQDFTQASPGMRFGPYFKVWSSLPQATINPGDKTAALKAAATLTSNDQACQAALIARQELFAQAQPAATRLTLDAVAIAPFMTGLGIEHPLENGFAFLNPYGLPYLPGSGVKGVLRAAASELASGDWGDTAGWHADAIDALFGPAPVDTTQGKIGDSTDDPKRRRGALVFWDVIPDIGAGKSLQLDIMTPHQSHYYQDATPPHDSGQPNPIVLLSVPPSSRFRFHVQCRPGLLRNTQPQLLDNNAWQHLLEAAFQHAFDWLGFGAKTAVGYGHMAIDEQAQQQRRKQAAIAEREQTLAALSEDQRALECLRELLKTDTTSKGPSGELWEALRRAVESADTWPAASRDALKHLANQTFKHLGVDRKKTKSAKALWKRLTQ